MAIGAQEIREHVGIARIALAPGGGVPRATRREHVGVNGHDAIAGLEERIDDEARATFDRDPHRPGRAEAGEALPQLREPARRMRDPELGGTPAGGAVEYTHVVVIAGPIEADDVRCIQWRFHPAPPS